MTRKILMGILAIAFVSIDLAACARKKQVAAPATYTPPPATPTVQAQPPAPTPQAAPTQIPAETKRLEYVRK